MSTLQSLKPAKVSSTLRYAQFFWRSWAIQSSWNYERQMNMGFLYGIAPTLERIYGDDPALAERKKEAYRRHMALYNCTPQTSAFVLGLASSMEEQYAADPEHFDPDSINAMKVSLMGPLSGIGDSFFQGTIRVIAFGLGASLALQGNILGPILAMLISIVPSVAITWLSGKFGYEIGSEYLKKLQDGHTMERVMYVCSIVGLMTIGGMAATVIGVTTPIKLLDGSIELQSILDGILPGILPLAIMFALFALIKKGVRTELLLIVSIVVAVILSVLGLLV